MSRLHLRSATATDIGQVREVNQDRVFLNGTVVAVADGMGGHAGGEVASALAVAELSGIRGSVSPGRLTDVIRAANKRIFAEGEKPELRGMGTTIVAATLDTSADILHILNVGDSRAYLIRGGHITQITRDHSLVADLVQQGTITWEEAAVHPQRNIVTRVLGIGPQIDVDHFEIEIFAGDRFVLCSDGLTNEVPESDIAALVAQGDAPEVVAQALVAAAVANGGRDNVSVAVLLVTGGDAPVLEDLEMVDAVDVGPATEPIDPVRIDAATSPDTETEASEGRRWRRVTIAVLGIATFALAWLAASSYAKGTWFVGERSGEVVIYNGRPGGFLFWDPTVVESTGVIFDDLDGASKERLASEVAWPTLAEAEQLVDSLTVAAPSNEEPDGN